LKYEYVLPLDYPCRDKEVEKLVGAPYDKCGCPEVYVAIFKESVWREKGEMYIFSLLNYHWFLRKSRQI
jgi:hypothetical protein